MNVATTLGDLDEAPIRSLALLIRHAARGPLPAAHAGNDVPLLPQGVAAAGALGRSLRNTLASVRTSPILRCTQTADALCVAAGVTGLSKSDTLLGGPGVFVEDPTLAWGSWRQHGAEEMIRQLIEGVVLPGLADPKLAANRLLTHIVGIARARPGVHVFITHDSLLAPAIAHLLGRHLSRSEWPGFLEPLAILPNDASITLRWRDRVKVLAWQ